MTDTITAAGCTRALDVGELCAHAFPAEDFVQTFRDPEGNIDYARLGEAFLDGDAEVGTFDGNGFTFTRGGWDADGWDRIVRSVTAWNDGSFCPLPAVQDDDDDETLPTVQSIRRAAGLSQAALAQKAGVSISLVTKIEGRTKDVATVAYGKLAAIARAVGLTTDEYAATWHASPVQITGLRAALKQYNALSGRRDFIGSLMLNRATGRTWTDETAEGGWIEYTDPAIADLGDALHADGYVTRWEEPDADPATWIDYAGAREMAETLCAQYADENAD